MRKDTSRSESCCTSAAGWTLLQKSSTLVPEHRPLLDVTVEEACRWNLTAEVEVNLGAGLSILSWSGCKLGLAMQLWST